MDFPSFRCLGDFRKAEQSRGGNHEIRQKNVGGYLKECGGEGFLFASLGPPKIPLYKMVQ